MLPPFFRCLNLVFVVAVVVVVFNTGSTSIILLLAFPLSAGEVTLMLRCCDGVRNSFLILSKRDLLCTGFDFFIGLFNCSSPMIDLFLPRTEGNVCTLFENLTTLRTSIDAAAFENFPGSPAIPNACFRFSELLLACKIDGYAAARLEEATQAVLTPGIELMPLFSFLWTPPPSAAEEKRETREKKKKKKQGKMQNIK